MSYFYWLTHRIESRVKSIINDLIDEAQTLSETQERVKKMQLTESRIVRSKYLREQKDFPLVCPLNPCLMKAIFRFQRVKTF